MGTKASGKNAKPKKNAIKTATAGKRTARPQHSQATDQRSQSLKSRSRFKGDEIGREVGSVIAKNMSAHQRMASKRSQAPATKPPKQTRGR